MSIVLDGTAGITFPVTAGSASAVQASSGRVLQVVNATYNTTSSTTSTSFVDTGITASITPSNSTSKVWVFVSINGFRTDSPYFTFIIANGSNTSLLSIMENQVLSSASLAAGISTSSSLLHSPATTSSYTYKVQFKVNTAGRVYINDYGTNSGSTSCTISLMEIAA